MPSFLPFEKQLREQGFNFIVGIDEVGRGPLAGPVVSAAVILKEKTRLPGLNDSKLLTAKKRQKLFNLILENALDYAVAIVPHTTIDEFNILNATRMAHDLCLRELSCIPEIALIDGCDKQIIDIPFINIIGGDRKIRSIAAASILAKVVRDTLMAHYSKEFPQYGFDQHFGYATRLHRSNLEKHGYCEIHRRSFTLKNFNIQSSSIQNSQNFS